MAPAILLGKSNGARLSLIMVRGEEKGRTT
jgi:hypothetical protein